MADRRYEGEHRRWREAEERWPRAGEVGEHDRPWHYPPESWPSRGGMYGMGGAERAYNAGGYGRGEYEEGYARRSYDRLAEVSTPWFGPDREGYADEGTLRAAWQLPASPRVRDADTYEGPDRWGGYHSVRGRAPKGYVRSDGRIHEDVCDRLMESRLDASDVEVKVENGEVTLTGTVRYRIEKRAIEDVAHGVPGVRDVHNRLRLSPRPGEGGEPLHS
ncbi:BON domain-containing protein [Myxococcaceae bacterium GXIMD 01537]